MCRVCSHRESMTHLVNCSVIQEYFWQEIIEYMDTLGLQTPEEGDRLQMFLILGCLPDGERGGKWKTVDPRSGVSGSANDSVAMSIR